jgi:hypothetical protein
MKTAVAKSELADQEEQTRKTNPDIQLFLCCSYLAALQLTYMTSCLASTIC